MAVTVKGDLHPKDPKKARNFLMTLRQMSLACDVVREMFLILMNIVSTWSIDAN